MEDLIGHSWCFKSPQGGQKHFYDSNGVHVQMFTATEVDNFSELPREPGSLLRVATAHRY